MVTIEQKPVAAGNWRTSGPPRKVVAVVLHVIEGSLSSADSWFNNPDANVSAHFGVGLDGAVHQWVGVHDVAHHAGIVDHPTWTRLGPGQVNAFTIGIEHEGYGKRDFPPEQLHASAMLAAWCCVRFRLAPTPADFPLHREIRRSKPCPGAAFDREAYLARVDSILRLLDGDVGDHITGLR